MTVLGLVALSLALAPRPASITPEVFSRMRTIEGVIAILFGVLGMVIVRAAIAKYSNLSKDLPVQKHETVTFVVALVAILGLMATTAAILFGTVNHVNPPDDRRFSRIGP